MTISTPAGRRGDWFLSLKGRQIWPLDLRPEDVDIVEIAHALANICRFGGHVPAGFYSVAQHSVLVASVLPPELRLVGLLHDATEAYCGDLVRPLKHSPELAAFREMENAMWPAIAERFGLPLAIPGEVKEADRRMLQTERRDLLAPREWNDEGHPDYPKPYDHLDVIPWPQRGIPLPVERFLRAFESYGGHNVPWVEHVDGRPDTWTPTAEGRR